MLYKWGLTVCNHWDWLFSLSIMFWNLLQAVARVNGSFLFDGCVVFHHILTVLSKDIWVVSSFWLFQIKLL